MQQPGGSTSGGSSPSQSRSHSGSRSRPESSGSIIPDAGGGGALASAESIAAMTAAAEPWTHRRRTSLLSLQLSQTASAATTAASTAVPPGRPPNTNRPESKTAQDVAHERFSPLSSSRGPPDAVLALTAALRRGSSRWGVEAAAAAPSGAIGPLPLPLPVLMPEAMMASELSLTRRSGIPFREEPPETGVTAHGEEKGGRGVNELGEEEEGRVAAARAQAALIARLSPLRAACYSPVGRGAAGGEDDSSAVAGIIHGDRTSLEPLCTAQVTDVEADEAEAEVAAVAAGILYGSSDDDTTHWAGGGSAGCIIEEDSGVVHQETTVGVGEVGGRGGRGVSAQWGRGRGPGAAQPSLASLPEMPFARGE